MFARWRFISLSRWAIRSWMSRSVCCGSVDIFPPFLNLSCIRLGFITGPTGAEEVGVEPTRPDGVSGF